MTKDEADIRAIIADYAKALHARNVDQLFAHKAADYLSFDLAPPLQHKGSGTDARAGTTSWFATWKGPIGWEDRDLAITVGDRVAFSTALAHMTGTKVDGEEVALWFRVTNGFVKENGAWKVVHIHHSVPFYMDGSFKACVDLKP
jgi:ketosteroid isomerase-like protein